eukprot:Rhum_TRINITY_DN14635_c7_g2::Rhum_TRINITY_DN14635_c7_g2_i1::g.105732::m.105732
MRHHARVFCSLVLISAAIGADECAMSNPCGGGQSCTDADTATDGNFRCSCTAPTAGLPVTGAPATCQMPPFTGECLDLAIQGACPLGQTCYDPDTMVADDWQCLCNAPSSGAAVTGGKAVCELDECTARCDSCAKDTCTAASQNCIDANQFGDKLHDWICMCTGASLPAFSYGSPAVCTINECSTPANTKVCGDAGQTCVDPNTDAGSAGDWKCECKKPYIGSALTAAATCTLDECLENFANCAASGQECNDPDKSSSSLLDWECVCVAPGQGSQKRGVALCTYPTPGDECFTHQHTCNSAGQRCKDPDPAVTGDWVCECFAPFTGTAITGAKADCTLDECTATCGSCAKTPTGDVCSDSGQLCKDLDTHAVSLKDWECSCINPQSGASKPMAKAVCVLNECVTHLSVCDPHTQVCEDLNPSPDSLNDWQCVCKLPARGVGKQAGATCVFDECTANGATCINRGQECVDPDKDPDKTDDWECRCIAPATGTAVAKVADCHYPMGDECEANQGTCSNKGQLCKDPDTAVADNWRCECVAPAEGVPATQKAAECIIDECLKLCPTCADTDGSGNVCTLQHQKCTDPDMHPDSLGDWTCNCALPGGTPTVRGPATCTVDDCATVSCGVGQECNDPDTKDDKRGDYICTCTVGVGSQVAGSAKCAIDECETNKATCDTLKQTCFDPDMYTADTWMCVCPAPATETQVGAVAACTYPGECADPSVAITCSVKGQTCLDPDTMAANNWACACIPPQTGAPHVVGAASCELDECVHQCATCAEKAHSVGGEVHNICTDAGQVCHDKDHAINKLSDWVCECTPPSVGAPSIGKPATCELDECLVKANNNTCGANQACNDPDKSVEKLGTWMCVCTPPYIGTPQAKGPADCVHPGTPCDTVVDQPACVGNSTCRWTGTKCLDKCESVKVEAACPGLEDCAWQNMQCAVIDCPTTVDEALCTAFPTCRWMGTKCLDNCNTAADEPACGALEECAWLNMKCSQIDCSKPADEAACTAFAECRWSGTKCLDKCQRAKVENFCLKRNDCVWQTTLCTDVDCTTPIDEPTCSDYPKCRWLGTKCLDKCVTAKAEPACTALEECAWQNMLCGELDCTLPTDPAQCTALSPQCRWTGEKCLDKCETVKQEISCPGLEGCAWQDMKCAEIDCTKAADRTACTALSTCRWKAPSGCIDKCRTASADAACQALEDCEWKNMKCSPVCSVAGAEPACTAMSDCEWRNMKCEYACAVATAEADCTAITNCEWKNMKCVPPVPTCTMAMAQADCTAITGCEWKNMKCDALCTTAMVQADCTAITGCEWKNM